MNTIYTDNSTYRVNVSGNSTPANQLTLSQLFAVNWQTDLIRSDGQFASLRSNPVQIDAANVGGFFTASTGGGNDNSIASYGGTAGTNLRWAEALWEVSMGLSLPQLVNGTPDQPDAPAFVPSNDPNFFTGTGQPACISCHGAGGSSLMHGFATFADIFDFTNQGLIYNTSPLVNQQKSLGSNFTTRNAVLNCLLGKSYPAGTPCNPKSNSQNVAPTQKWDLSQWQSGGLLAYMGWTGATSGTGLNSLGSGIANAALTYQFMVSRVLSEICPNSGMSLETRATIATTAQTLDQGSGNNPFGYIVATIAADPNCHW
jgi:hypothetical protein